MLMRLLDKRESQILRLRTLLLPILEARDAQESATVGTEKYNSACDDLMEVSYLSAQEMYEIVDIVYE